MKAGNSEPRNIFEQQKKDGFHSDNFKLDGNIAQGDQREGLADTDILKVIMVMKPIT